MKFLVCYNGSAASKKVLNIALQEAKAFHASLFIVTALEQSEALTKEEIDRSEVRLENLCADLKTEHLAVESRVLVSLASPGEGLVQFAKENEVDKIFIGIEKQSKVGKLVFGSTAQYVILKAPCPVVTTREM
ncbi:MAG: universal stress protein [Deltaproteobacteria bacterium]|nr:universal stress protein [Deltaproteobacteria bacterium]